MNRMILVPIDISDTELTDRVIKHVEAEETGFWRIKGKS